MSILLGDVKMNSGASPQERQWHICQGFGAWVELRRVNCQLSSR